MTIPDIWFGFGMGVLASFLAFIVISVIIASKKKKKK